jgi:hypothetical protein
MVKHDFFKSGNKILRQREVSTYIIQDNAYMNEELIKFKRGRKYEEGRNG